VQRRTPVRTYGLRPTGVYNGWGEVNEAGWLEIDLGAHCGKWMEGRFLWTLVATDMATGWSELKEAGWLEIDLVAHCGKWMEGRFLWTLVATEMATSCSECLPRRVEQKNGMLIRRVVGYQRLEGLEAAELLGEL